MEYTLSEPLVRLCKNFLSSDKKEMENFEHFNIPAVLNANSSGMLITVPLTVSGGISGPLSATSITGNSGYFNTITGSTGYFTSQITIPIASTGLSSVGSIFFCSTDRKLYIYDDSSTGWIRSAAFT